VTWGGEKGFAVLEQGRIAEVLLKAEGAEGKAALFPGRQEGEFFF
jgi:hypothetical protein